MSCAITASPAAAVEVSAPAQGRPAKAHQGIPELDGVRGIAILLVLLFHLEVSYPSAVPRWFFAPFLIGWSGVDLFFVLSGFLITGILIDTRACGNYFSSFYMRRVLRIMPLYLLAVFAYFAVALPLAHHGGAWRTRDASPQLWFWLHLSNWPPAFGTVVPFIGHFWSLSVEEQFYLVWPLVVFAVSPRRLVAVCASVAVAALAFRVAFLNRNFVYYLTPFRMDALGVGCLAAAIVRNPRLAAAVRRRTGGIACAAASILLLAMLAARSPRPFNPWMSTIGYTSWALLYGSLVFAAYSQTGAHTWLATQLRRPFLRSFGKYSYAIYVIHTAMITAVDTARARLSAGMSPHGRTAVAFGAMAASIALSYLAARVSWVLLEKRCLALKSRFAARASSQSTGAVRV